MTSSPVSECFVYITLPDETNFVTAGKFVLEQNRRGDPLGRFIYGRSYLDNPKAVSIDPIDLKLTDRTYETALLNGVFGALRDAGPDFWGRRIIEKHAGKPQLGEIDYLLEAPDDHAGALGFGLGPKPPAPKRRFNKTIALEKLQEIADAFVKEITPDDTDAAQIQDLMLIGTSMGGARPKAVVEDDAGLYLAKFNRFDDRWNNARVEHAMLELAKICGLSAAESRIESIGGKDVLLVSRFDRSKVETGYTRARMLSGLTLLRADEGQAGRDRWSYVYLVEELRRVAADARKDGAELFRRMCFNALISNLDDHPRNHALIAKDRDWKLSPAFDLTPAPVISDDRRDLAMSCGDQGRFANAANLLSEHARFLLSEEEARKTLDEITEIVRSSWHKTVRSCGVSERDAERIKGAFVYDGFER